MSNVWFIECFGPLKARRETQIVERFRTQKTAALLALLALRGACSREKLCDYLWSENAPEAARNSLSAALSFLRKEMGDEFIRADRFQVALAPDSFQTDVEAFDLALKNRDFAAATALYRGHLLGDFHDEPFPSLTREYEEKARGAFKNQLEILENRADWNEVLSLARRFMLLFGSDDRVFLSLMRAHHGLNDLDAALRAYDELGKWARKNGELTSEAARQFAKLLRREKEQKAAQKIDFSSKAEENPTLNLPAQWTPFFGRENEIETLRVWLCGGERFVTLTGAGGSGKTRLALEACLKIAAEFNNRVDFVPLAALFEAQLLYPSIRDALGLKAAPDLPPFEQIVRSLRGQKRLIILDNFEQLAQNGAPLLHALREKLPDCTFLVTSRAILHLPGEREFPVWPLPTPLPDSKTDEIALFSSAAMFCDRANLSLGDGNAPAIGALCRRLDGIPLAIELAAGRAKVLSPAQILERLGSHPDFLQTREYGVPARHKTLRATIEWSVDLLPAVLRQFFARLGVFRGGFSLEAAENICCFDGCQAHEVLDYLEQLRSHSLLVTLETPLGTRYRLLEMLREWGENALDETEKNALRKRHFEWFMLLAQQNHNPVTLAQNGAILRAENANFRAALSFALEQENAVPIAQISTALFGFWEANALGAEGREWGERAIAKTLQCEELGCVPLDKAQKAKLWCCAGAMAWHCGNYNRATELLEWSAQQFRELGDELAEIEALDYYARVLGVTGQPAQERVLGVRVIEVARQHNDIGRLLSSLITTAWGCLNSNHHEEAIAYLNEAITLSEAIGEKRAAMIARASRLFPLLLLGRVEQAIQTRDEMLELADETLDPWTTAFVRGSAAIVALALGEIEHAREVLPDCALRFNAISTRWEVASVLAECGNLASAIGDFERAVLIYGATQTIREQSGHVMLTCLEFNYQIGFERVRQNLDAAHIETLWQRGLLMSLDEVVALTQELRGTQNS